MNAIRLLLSGLFASASLAFATAADAVRPNIVFILADDLGIGDVGCYGQKKIHTPNIDRLAAEGMRFTQFYTGNAVCAPSRCALMTGMHMGHATVRNNGERGPVEGQRAMAPTTVTVAQLLQKAGYATGIIGKWGLGMPDERSGPNDFGFDYAYGYLCQRVAHTYYPDHLWRNAVSEAQPGNPPTKLAEEWDIPAGGAIYSHDLLADDALKFVRERQAKPFFLYLAFTTPHFSLQVPEDSMAEYQFPEEHPYAGKHYAPQPRPRAAYAGMITRMDRSIGRLMAELKTQGLDEKTIVFFSSDNGVAPMIPETIAQFFGSAAGFRGMKGELYEGGIHTPLLARWPGRIAPGSTADYVGAFWDMLPTVCELAGAKATPCDGLSFVPTLLGRGTAQPAHESLYWEFFGAGGSQAVRIGDWKGICLKRKGHPEAPLELYNLRADRAETADLSKDHPEMVARMKAIMAQRVPSDNPQWNF